MGGLRKTVFFVSGLQLTPSSSKKKENHPPCHRANPFIRHRKAIYRTKWLRWGKKTWRQAKSLRQALKSFEPPISCLQDRRINHYATEPHMSFENDKKFITTNWQINKHQHTSQHVRFRERKKIKVHIDQSAGVYIFSPVRKTVALTSMIHTMQHFTREELLPLCQRAW